IEFVTKKITDAVARISMGYTDYLELGNLDAKRDWGFAGDFVEAMWLMMQRSEPDDFVIATGKSHSVKEFCKEAFSIANLDYEKYVRTDKQFMRPVDVRFLLGDPSKAKKVLGWEPKTTFKELVTMMVEADIAKYKDPMEHAQQFLKHI
ncbi:MAG: GDP-mannose 4,6-dehydratase, partial [Minisyncoccia bacterium]